VKILYILRYFPTITETFIYEEISGLLNNGIEVEILSLGKRSDGQHQKNLPICPVHTVPRSRLRRFLSPTSKGEKWLIQYQRPKDTSRLHWIEQFSKGFDLIRVHFAGEAAEIAYAIHLDTGLQFSVTTHAVDIFSPRPAWKEVLSMAREVISISKYNQEYLLSNGICSVLIPCGVNIEQWPSFPCDEGSLKALFIGRDVPKKGLDVLLNAFSALPIDFQLRVISDRKAASTDQIKFLPLMNRTEMQKHLRWCNVVVLPCRIAKNGDRDGIPVVLMEAMASGRPVITTDLPGITELVSTNVGWIAKVNCSQSLKDCLITANDPLERNKRALQARKYIINSSFVAKKQVYSLINTLVT